MSKYSQVITELATNLSASFPTAEIWMDAAEYADKISNLTGDLVIVEIRRSTQSPEAGQWSRRSLELCIELCRPRETDHNSSSLARHLADWALVQQPLESWVETYITADLGVTAFAASDIEVELQSKLETYASAALTMTISFDD